MRNRLHVQNNTPDPPRQPGAWGFDSFLGRQRPDVLPAPPPRPYLAGRRAQSDPRREGRGRSAEVRINAEGHQQRHPPGKKIRLSRNTGRCGREVTHRHPAWPGLAWPRPRPSSSLVVGPVGRCSSGLPVRAGSPGSQGSAATPASTERPAWRGGRDRPGRRAAFVVLLTSPYTHTLPCRG